MAKIKPFRALRFTEKAGDINELVCPPYDIISEEQRQNYLKQNEYNIIRLELPREGDDPYRTAGDTINRWMDEGILKTDDKPALYIYEEEFTVSGETKKVKGFTCRVRLEEFEAGVVLPHEETLSKAKADRFELMKATGCNFSSIYSLYFDEERAIYGIIDKASEGKPCVEFKIGDGVTHRLWMLTDENTIEEIRSLMQDKKIYIADGHHRYETALNYKKDLAVRGKIDSKDDDATYIMMTLMHMEHEGLAVFPTHRVVRGLAGFDNDKMQNVIETLKQYFDISGCEKEAIEKELKTLADNGDKAFAVYHGNKAYLLVLRDKAIMRQLLPDKSEAYQNLDVTILHTLILERSFGIDKENMASQKNLAYVRDVSEAISAADNGDADFSVIINATKVSEIAAVAGAGEKMPQKSTYFYPKLITGLTVNLLFFYKKEKQAKENDNTLY